MSRATAKDVAAEAGVSRATVGFVLNNTRGQTISPETRRRVQDAAAKIGYRPHSAAQSLARGSSRIVLLVLPNWPSGHSLQVHLEEASHALALAGYTLVTYTPFADSAARPLWETLSPDVVLGLEPFSDAQLESMHAVGITKISPPDTPPGQVPFAELGARLQAEHLYEAGHTHIAYAHPDDPRLHSLAATRANEVQKFASSRAMACDEHTLSRDNVNEKIQQWIADGTTGIAAYNDDVAALIVGAAVRANVDVPGSISVIGHDDAPISALFVPSISTIHIDNSRLGQSMASMALYLAGEKEAPEPISSMASLTVRESTSTGKL